MTAKITPIESLKLIITFKPELKGEPEANRIILVYTQNDELNVQILWNWKTAAYCADNSDHLGD